jgi:hypothetical protein
MPNGFTKSKKGVEEYAKVNKQYENTTTDNDIETFERRTANSPHSAKNKKVVQVMVREMADDGEQYLVYDLSDRRYTAIGAEVTQYMPSQGKYPIPIVQPRIEMGPNMTTQEIVNGPIIRYDVGYEIPFTKANVDRIHQMADDKSQTARTQYIVKRAGGMKHSVNKYEDFRDGDFEDLETKGRITLTEEEVKAKQKALQDAEKVLEQAKEPEVKQEAATTLITGGKNVPQEKLQSNTSLEEGKLKNKKI